MASSMVSFPVLRPSTMDSSRYSRLSGSIAETWAYRGRIFSRVQRLSYRYSSSHSRPTTAPTTRTIRGKMVRMRWNAPIDFLSAIVNENRRCMKVQLATWAVLPEALSLSVQHVAGQCCYEYELPPLLSRQGQRWRASASFLAAGADHVQHRQQADRLPG